MNRIAVILLSFGALLPLTSGTAAVVYRSGEGWSSEGSADPTPTAATASAQLRQAESLESAGDAKSALGAYRALVKKFPDSGVAPRAQSKVAELYEKQGDFNRSFDAYKVYIEKYPRGEDFDKAVETQFKIARMFLEGEKTKLLGIPIASSMARAQEMFESLVKNAPFSSYAPLSQFHIGQALEKQGKLPEAIVAYQAVLLRYPSDAVAADAQYQLGYVYLKQSREGSYDRQASGKAAEAFQDFISRYPESEKIPQAKENLSSLSGTETKGVYNIAKFYDKQKNYKAAFIYYNDVIRQQPGSAESKAAQTRLDELKTQVGEEALKPAQPRAENGARAQGKRKLQAQVDTRSRPDYLGPPVVVVPDEVPASKPKPRTSAEDIGPVPAVEPPLPTQ